MKKINIVITSGGTSEKIDNVRKITNSSSGKLGSIIANYARRNLKIDNIFYVCSKKAILPSKNKYIKIIYADDTSSLKNVVEKLLTENKIDVFIHSMAVSDFTIDKVVDYSELKNNYSSFNNFDDLVNSIKNDNSSKIASNATPILFLKQTPKIISIIKEKSPQTFLVGFKLLCSVENDVLLHTAKNLMNKNNCDLVVANDLTQISKDKHHAYIIDRNNNVYFSKTKKQIAKTLIRRIKIDYIQNS